MKYPALVLITLFSAAASANPAPLNQFLKAIEGNWRGQDQTTSTDGVSFYDLQVEVKSNSSQVWNVKSTEIDASTPGAVFVNEATLHVSGARLSIGANGGELVDVHVIASTANALTYSVETLNPQTGRSNTITSEMDLDTHGVFRGHNTIFDGNFKTVDETYSLSR